MTQPSPFTEPQANDDDPDTTPGAIGNEPMFEGMKFDLAQALSWAIYGMEEAMQTRPDMTPARRAELQALVDKYNALKRLLAS